MANDVVALFELTLQDGQVRVVEERHYKLLPADMIDRTAIADYHDV